VQRSNEDTRARQRKVVGEDHPDALISANNPEPLCALGEHTSGRRRRRIIRHG
jgi:hypothetical protein